MQLSFDIDDSLPEAAPLRALRPRADGGSGPSANGLMDEKNRRQTVGRSRRSSLAQEDGCLLQLNGRLGNAARRLVKAYARNIVAYAASTVTAV